MNPVLWFAAGWLFAWLPLLFVLGLTWIIDRNSADEDKYWTEKAQPLRGVYVTIKLDTQQYERQMAKAQDALGALAKDAARN